MYLAELLEAEHECARGKREANAVLLRAFVELHLRDVDFRNRVLHEVHNVLQKNFVGLRHVAQRVLWDRCWFLH